MNDTPFLAGRSSVDILDVAKISKFDPATLNPESTHGWLDARGMETRHSYVTAEGQVYPTQLFVGRAKDGRNILYGVNVSIKEGVAVAKNFAHQENGGGSVKTTPSKNSIQQFSETSMEKLKTTTLR